MNTTENNKLIAEFMVNNEGGLVEIRNGIYSTLDEFDMPDDYLIISDLEYHEDWNWLMGVVEKINNTKDDFDYEYTFSIGNSYVWVDSHIGDRIYFSGNDIEHREEPMINKVYRGVVEFIKWYNKQQN